MINNSESVARPALVGSEISSQLRLAIREKHQKALIETHPLDFWFIGGVSFIAWLLSLAAQQYAYTNPLFDRQIMNWPFAFSALTLVCNHPHFISSYRIGYSQGVGFLMRNWFSMLFVPVSLAFLFCTAYMKSSSNFGNIEWLARIDAKWSGLPIVDTAVHSPDLGSDLLRTGVWVMWLSVGWHYSKQVFGIMLVSARSEHYSLTKFHRQILKYCLLSVVPTNFLAASMSSDGTTWMFEDLKLFPFAFSEELVLTCKCINVILALSFAVSLAVSSSRSRVFPPLNFVAAFVAFHLWWYPGFWPQPYAMLMIPFFHSLQYLPFAFRRLKSDLSPRVDKTRALTINILSILAIGFFLFDLLPGYLDQYQATNIHFGSSFYLISIVVFLNVHHFFIDSVIWKSNRSVKTEI